MDNRYDTQQLITLRKLTRAVSETLRGHLVDYLFTLSPILRPKTIFGEYIQGGSKEPVRGADKAFNDLLTLYQSIAPAKPFFLSKELTPPIEITSSSLEVTVMEYSYDALLKEEGKNVTITSPLKWFLSYSGFTPARLRNLMNNRNRSSTDVNQFILQNLILHLTITRSSASRNESAISKRLNTSSKLSRSIGIGFHLVEADCGVVRRPLKSPSIAIRNGVSSVGIPRG